MAEDKEDWQGLQTGGWTWKTQAKLFKTRLSWCGPFNSFFLFVVLAYTYVLVTTNLTTSHIFLTHCNWSRSQSPPSPWPAVGKRELWEQPFYNNKGNNRILPIRFHAVCIYGACLKWLLPEVSIPAAGQKDRELWGRECLSSFSEGKMLQS